MSHGVEPLAGTSLFAAVAAAGGVDAVLAGGVPAGGVGPAVDGPDVVRVVVRGGVEWRVLTGG